MLTSLEEAKALGWGLLVGDDSGMSREFKQLFQEAGILHLTAASGANLGLVAGLVAPWRTSSRWPGEIGLAIAYLVYWHISGGSGSLWRATLMAGLILLGRLSGRRLPVWFALFTAIWLTGIFSNEYYRNYGFWLSAGAMVGLVFSQALKPGENSKALLPHWQILIFRLFFTLFASTIIASAVAPLVWMFFGSWSLLSAFSTPVAQLFVVPLQLFSVMVFGSEQLLKPIAPLAEACLLWIFAIFADAIRLVAKFSQSPSFGLFSAGWYGLCLAWTFRVFRFAWISRRRSNLFGTLNL